MRKVCIVEEATDLVGAEMHRQNRILGLVEAKHPKPVCYDYKWNSCCGTGEIVEVVALWCYYSSQKEGKIRRNSAGISLDGDHLSPGSVLEASFSNDSCFSSSLDDSSGCRMLLDSMDYSYDQPQPVVTDADHLDCATSLIQGRTGSKIATDLLNHVSEILLSINLAGGRLSGNQLTHAKEVILNTELLFGNAILCNSDRMKRSLIGPFLLDGHEALAGAMWKNLNCLLGFEDSKDAGTVTLDSKAWKRIPSCMNVEMLIQEIGEEIFEIEGFETGAEIDWDILQTLVEEIAVDLWESRVDSF
ncbi:PHOSPHATIDYLINOSITOL N-ACETYLGLUCOSAMINYLTRANSFERASE SUBUNIT P DOWN SYNDROME CRITICAL REGION PROTEIN 5 -RELATED [Salix viminalis]|uniref:PHOSPHATIDYLINOSITOL N-ACETYLGLUCOSAMINYLTRANSFERASE SUBUNIT P DOWN SYNDROME CRITICAL REGION PROTEIN 5 -RELATED n=1 Tax=Salix viminalis TaxID=40686 RepID=A0A9Q0P9Y1_SALVM|nr:PHOSPHATIDYLINOSITOL N-ACETYLGLUCOSAMINYLTRANSFERASE SUBUNIT P DOWN SYNDROME CRITICAL REGION PROTEIN 5 -RELATED [Salix viminalis]